MRRFGVVFGALTVALVLGACVPTFPAGSGLQAQQDGDYVHLSWIEATEPDDGQEVSQYRIDVDGREVSRVPAWVTTCTLKGLYNSTSYDITVTAYDTNNEWSGSNEDGILSTTYTTPSDVDAGGDLYCDTGTPE